MIKTRNTRKLYEEEDLDKIYNVVDKIINSPKKFRDNFDKLEEFINAVGFIYIDFDVAGLSGGKSVLVGQLLQQRLQLNGFAFELEGFAAFHTHREDLLDHSFQLLQLALADFQVFAAFLRIIARIEVKEGVVGSVGDGHRGLEFMRDVLIGLQEIL